MTALDPQDLDRAACAARDAADPLVALREQFDLPPGVNYLDGNSLGVLPRAIAARVHDVVTREWGQGLIRSWNSAGWIELPRRVGDKIGRLVGAAPGELVVAESTSVNLFKVLSAAARIAQADDAARRVIVSGWVSPDSRRNVTSSITSPARRWRRVRPARPASR